MEKKYKIQYIFSSATWGGPKQPLPRMDRPFLLMYRRGRNRGGGVEVAPKFLRWARMELKLPATGDGSLCTIEILDERKGFCPIFGIIPSGNGI